MCVELGLPATGLRLELIDKRFGTLAFCPRWIVEVRAVERRSMDARSMETPRRTRRVGAEKRTLAWFCAVFWPHSSDFKRFQSLTSVT